MGSKAFETVNLAQAVEPERAHSGEQVNSQAALRRRRMAQIAKSIAAMTPGDKRQDDAVELLRDDRAR